MNEFVEINSAKESLWKLGVIDIRMYPDTTFVYLMGEGEICLANYEFKKGESVDIDKAIKHIYVKAVEKGLIL